MPWLLRRDARGGRPSGAARCLLSVSQAGNGLTEVTEGGTLRQPSIKDLRTDVIPTEVVADAEIRGLRVG